MGFEIFFQLFNKTYDRHAPIKKSTSKEEKIKFKPWTTKGIKKFISIRDKFYKEMIKEKNVLLKYFNKALQEYIISAMVPETLLKKLTLMKLIYIFVDLH